MSWQCVRRLVRRGRSSLTFELDLREKGVLRDSFRLTVNAALGVSGIKAELKRAALARVQSIVAGRSGAP
jgi:hypothetical protein